MIPFIDLTRQHAALRAELLAASARVIDSSQFVLGPEGKALEQELAALCGVPWALGVASGTDALSGQDTKSSRRRSRSSRQRPRS